MQLAMRAGDAGEFPSGYIASKNGKTKVFIKNCTREREKNKERTNKNKPMRRGGFLWFYVEKFCEFVSVWVG